MAFNFGAEADRLYDMNQKLAKANAAVKELENQKREIENTLLAAMQDAGTDIVRGKKSTVSISENERVSIEDWDKFEPFLYRKKAAHLFERRISTKSYRDLVAELGNKPVPGLAVFTTLRLNVRKA